MARERYIEVALFAVATLGSGARALGLGQDINPDQLIYHVYLGWTLLAGRLDQDVAPVGIGSYMNPPLVHTLSYLGLTCLPPRVHGFVLGSVQGVNVFLAYRLARVVLRGLPREQALSALAGLIAATGACAVSLLGTTFVDNLVSILVLAAFLVVARVADEPGPVSGPRLMLAGALGTGAVGLKLTFAIYLLALSTGVVLLAVRRRSARVILAFAAGGALGYPLTGGYWAVEMWRRFGNPVFPLANHLFQSPFFASWALYDGRWVMRSWTEILSGPFEMAFGRTRGMQEIAFRDPRCAVVIALAVAAAAGAIRRRRINAAPASAWVVVVGWLVAYVVWMRVFHYYRYFAAGEFIAPVAMLGLLRLLDVRRISIVWLAVVVVVTITTRTALWGRMDWRDEPLHVSVPLRPTEPPAVVMVDGYGFSFVLPFFPSGTRFFGAHGVSEALDGLVAHELERHQGPVFRLRTQGGAPASLLRFGLEDEGPCDTFRTGGRGRLSLCPLARVPPAVGARSANRAPTYTPG